MGKWVGGWVGGWMKRLLVCQSCGGGEECGWVGGWLEWVVDCLKADKPLTPAFEQYLGKWMYLPYTNPPTHPPTHLLQESRRRRRSGSPAHSTSGATPGQTRKEQWRTSPASSLVWIGFWWRRR